MGAHVSAWIDGASSRRLLGRKTVMLLKGKEVDEPFASVAQWFECQARI